MAQLECNASSLRTNAVIGLIITSYQFPATSNKPSIQVASYFQQFMFRLLVLKPENNSILIPQEELFKKANTSLFGEINADQADFFYSGQGGGQLLVIFPGK